MGEGSDCSFPDLVQMHYVWRWTEVREGWNNVFILELHLGFQFEKAAILSLQTLVLCWKCEIVQVLIKVGYVESKYSFKQKNPYVFASI